MQMTAVSHERPFPGLRPFGFADHPFFFGRDDQVYAIYRLLDRSRFIAVVGTSGGGKSSLVRAGLLPLLHQETIESGGRNWKCFELRPGDSPISSLTDALAGPPPAPSDENKSAIHAARRERIAYAFRHSSFGLVEAIADLNDVEGRSILLLVDQFEELFRFSSIDRTINRDAAEEARRREEAAQFVQLLLEASRSQEPEIHVLITMRSDFIGDCARFHGLPEAVSATQFLVPSLTRDQREEVIRKPIEKAEATIDGALVERLLNDSNDEFDLPVLQHCLMRIWEEAGLAASPTDNAAPAGSGTPAPAAPTSRHLCLAHYDKVGRIARALSLHADAIMASLPGRAVAVEQTFRALSDVDKDGRATRRALSFQRLLEETGVAEDDLCQVVDRFRGEDCSFLVPPPSLEATLAAATRIDVGHEALLRRWERISSAATAELGARQAQHTGWLAAEEMDGRTYRAVLALIDSAPPGSRVTLPLDQVEARAKWWNARKRTQAWAERYGGGLDRVEQLFKDSRDALEAQQQREKATQEAQRESEIKSAKLDAERQKAEAEAALQRTQSRSNRRVTALAVALAVVTAVAAIGAWQRYREAEVKRIESLSIQTRFLASQSEQETMRGNTRTGILLALAAVDRQKDLGRDIADPGMALYGALGDHIGETIIGKYERGQPFEFNLAGQRLLTLSEDKNVVILDPTGNPLVTLPHEVSVPEAVFNADGTRVASASRDGKARIWDAGGTLLATLPHSVPVTGIMFSQQGDRVVTIADDNTARVWPVSGGEAVELAHKASLTSARINSDGSLVVTVEADRIVRVWDVATRAPEILQHPDAVTFAAFSPDGTRVVTICRDRNVRVWNAKDNKVIYSWPHDSTVRSAVFSPNGKNVATAADDQTVRVWDATAQPARQTGLALPPPASATAALRHEGNPNLIKFSKSGSKLITIAEDNVVRLWSARGRRLAALQHKESVEDISFNADETEILTASGGQLRSWHLNNALERRLIGAEDVETVIMSADGTRILGAGGTRGVHVWDENGKAIPAESEMRGTPTDPRLFAQRLLILTRFWGDNLRLADVSGKHIFLTHGSISAVSGDAARIVVQNNKKKMLEFWSVSGEQIRVVSHDKEVRRLATNRDGSRAATVTGDGTVEIWSETGELIAELRLDDYNEPARTASRPPMRQASGKAESPRSVPERSFAFDAALKRILVLNYEEGVAALWDDRHNKAWSRPLDASMRFAAFSPDGRSLLFRAGSTAQLRNVADDRIVTLQHDGEVVAAQFSPDGSRILTTSADKDHVRVWDGRGEGVTVLRHDRAVRSAWFSASGEQVVTIDAENTVRVWESRGRQIAEIPHDGRVSVSVDAGGKRLVTVAAGNEPRIFNLYHKLDDLLALAASLNLVPLTADERKRHFVD